MSTSIGNPGIIVYDNFQTAPSFGATITASIDPVQYWRDRPLFLGYINPSFNDAVKWNNGEYDKYITNPELQSYLNSAKEIVQGIDQYEIEANRIKDSIQNYSNITSGDADQINYPVPDPNPSTIEIKDADGNIIDTIITDTNVRETKNTSSGEVPITILDYFPDGYNDNTQNTTGDIPTIVTLPDSYIRDKLWITKDKIPELTQELNSSYNIVIDPINNMVDIIAQPDPEDPADYVDGISRKQGVWYGIPLINLSPRGTPLKDSVIIHINTAKNFTLDITNVIGTGLEKLSINIDKTIPPDTRFTAGVYFAGTRLKLYLKIEGDPEIYSSSITMTESPKLELRSFGTDNEFRKSLCGTIWDLRYLEKDVPFNSDPSTPIPLAPPSDEFFWDNNNDRVRGDSSYPLGNGRKPTYNSGAWLDMDQQWKAVHNSYMDRFFCRGNLINSSFSISWFQYLFRYPGGVSVLLSDNLNSNYIKYDWNTHELIVEFNSVIHREKLTLPEQLWTYFSIRFNKDTDELTVLFRDIFWDREEKIILDIGSGLTFELMSIMGRFDRAERRYVETFKATYTLIHIASKYKTDLELDTLYQNHKIFLKKYDIRTIPSSNRP